MTGATPSGSSAFSLRGVDFFDRSQVSYQRLIEVFFRCHNPTTLNRQGPDVGTQYRSAVFFHDSGQECAARAYKEKLESSGSYRPAISTEITPVGPFYAAEEYHQRYLEKRGAAHCQPSRGAPGPGHSRGIERE